MYRPQREPVSYSKEKKNKRKKLLQQVLVTIVLGFVLAIFIRMYLFYPFHMVNDFMAPNFPAGKTVYVTPLFNKNNLLIGDMVVIRHPLNDTVFVSRIAGKAEDRISLKNKILYRNGNPIGNETGKYAFSDTRTPYPINFSHRDNMEEIIILENKWFVLSDNRDKGLDSRFLGLISSENLIGKVIF